MLTFFNPFTPPLQPTCGQTEFGYERARPRYRSCWPTQPASAPQFLEGRLPLLRLSHGFKLEGAANRQPSAAFLRQWLHAGAVEPRGGAGFGHGLDTCDSSRYRHCGGSPCGEGSGGVATVEWQWLRVPLGAGRPLSSPPRFSTRDRCRSTPAPARLLAP